MHKLLHNCLADAPACASHKGTLSTQHLILGMVMATSLSVICRMQPCPAYCCKWMDMTKGRPRVLMQVTKGTVHMVFFPALWWNRFFFETKNKSSQQWWIIAPSAHHPQIL